MRLATSTTQRWMVFRNSWWCVTQSVIRSLDRNPLTKIEAGSGTLDKLRVLYVWLMGEWVEVVPVPRPYYVRLTDVVCVYA